MTNLAEQQSALLALLKKRPLPVHAQADHYLSRVAESRELNLLREIAVWWRAFGIERNCPHTALLLKRLGRFEPTVEAFYCRHAASPFMEELAAQFLEVMSRDADPLVAAMAGFELAVLRTSQGDPREFDIDWDRNPDDVFIALRSEGPLPEPNGSHRVTVAWRPSSEPDRSLP